MATICSGAISLHRSAMTPIAPDSPILCANVSALMPALGTQYCGGSSDRTKGILVVRMGGSLCHNAIYPKVARGYPRREYVKIFDPATDQDTVTSLAVDAARQQRWAATATQKNPIIVGGYPRYAWAFSEHVAWPNGDGRWNVLNWVSPAVVTPWYDYGIGSGGCYVRNVLSELTEPGEWVLDYEKGLLYLYPLNNAPLVELSASEYPLLVLDHVQGRTITGVTFEMSRNLAVLVNECEDIVFDRCIFRHLGAYAALVQKSKNVRFQDCWFHDLGRGAICFRDCGDINTHVSSGCSVRGCWFERIDLVQRTNAYGVHVFGSEDVKMLGNTFSDGRGGQAVELQYAGHSLVQDNIFYRYCFDLGDIGAIAGGGEQTTHDIVVKDNIFWKLGQAEPVVSAGYNPVHNQSGVYWDDDGMHGCPVLGNLFYECSAGLKGYYIDLAIQDNIFDHCQRAFHRAVCVINAATQAQYLRNRARAIVDAASVLAGTEMFTADPDLPFYKSASQIRALFTTPKRNPRPGTDKLSLLARLKAEQYV